VHRSLREPHAVDAVVGIGWHAANGVARIDESDTGIDTGGEVLSESPARVWDGPKKPAGLDPRWFKAFAALPKLSDRSFVGCLTRQLIGQSVH
jgi:hypothetical protein